MLDMTKFEEALQSWLERAQAIVDVYFVQNFPTLKCPVLTLDRGRRYIRVVRSDPGSRSVHCFIDTLNGDVLKADGWKKPAKGARGSIFEVGKEGVSSYGGLYAR
jgi:hypothetical protein